MNEDTPVKADPGREARSSIPEAVFARFKDDSQLIGAVMGLLPDGKVLVTKATDQQIDILLENFEDIMHSYDRTAGTMVMTQQGYKWPDPKGNIGILSAGSSDYSVAEEAAISAEFMGLKVHRCYDCGVAGIHRVEQAVQLITEHDLDVLIVVAGMEGALPSVIAGGIKTPVIGVPTSVGYGTGMGGLSAVLGMLNSCAPGITVVNIDNGFGAAAAAAKMLRWLKGPRD